MGAVAFEESWEFALRGDFRPLLASGPEMGRAEQGATAALYALATPSAAPPPGVLGAAGSTLGLRYRALSAFLAEDLSTLEEIYGHQQALSAAPQDIALSKRWLALATGNALPEPPVEYDSVGRLTAGIQRALDLLAQGQLPEATRQARQTARMARTDGLVFHESLAALALSRIRRHSGKPHLATRILDALASVAPVPWWGWIGWERCLNGLPPHREGNEQVRWRVTARWEAFIHACSRGDADAAGAMTVPATSFALFREELRIVLEACDTRRRPSDVLVPFLQSATDTVPGAIAGLVVPIVKQDGSEKPTVFLITGPSLRRRVLSLGVPLLGLPDEATLDDAYQLTQEKPFRLLSVLGAAGPVGATTQHTFQQIYGFDYEAARHSGVLRTLLSRARKLLPPSATIERTDDRLTLVHAQTLAFPDPRCASDRDALLLRALAERGGRATARELATSVGVSTRTVQLSLKGLLAQGACDVEGKGRSVAYLLEDTTFYRPTLDRLAPRGLAPQDR